MYKNILIGVDGSDNNKRAVTEAVDIAKSMGAKLTAVYVVLESTAKAQRFSDGQSKGDLAEEVKKNAEKAFEFAIKKAKESGIELHTMTVLASNAGNAIVELSSDYDLVVCGSLGLTGMKRALMGSVSSTVSRYAECPVLISRGN